MKALDQQKLITKVNEVSSQELFDTVYALSKWINSHWVRDQLDNSFMEISNEIPMLNEVIDFKLLQLRLAKFDTFRSDLLGIHISLFAPEFLEVLERTSERLLLIPQGIEKARLWLHAVAQFAGANGFTEAAVYFASRDDCDEVLRNRIEREWYSAICDAVISKNGVADPVRKRASKRNISLSEAADILDNFYGLDRFFYFLDADDDYIDATMFRAVEWCNITGYDAWLKSLARQFTQDSISGIDPDMISRISWFLFFWCSSDFALSMTDRTSLQTFLWSLVHNS